MSKALRRALRNDVKYMRVVASMVGVDDKVDANIDEMMGLHSKRGIRALNTTALLQSSVHVSIDTTIDNQAVRSRVVELKMRAFQKLLIVDEKLDRLIRYVQAHYAAVLATEAKTLADRKAIVQDQLRDVIKVKKRLEGVMKLADMVIEDCDAAGYSSLRINQMLELKSKDR